MMSTLDKFKKLYADYKSFDASKLPLCAAETYVSDFTKQALNSCLEGKYIMGNLKRSADSDFIGGEKLFPIYQLLSEECRHLFGAKYADARPLTGMNTVMLVLMCLTKAGDKVLLTTPEQGGHASVPKILDRLMVQYESVPYDYKSYQIDYEQTNKRLAKGDITAIIFCQSDLLQPPELSLLKIPSSTRVLYDATQTMGLIIGKQVACPLDECPSAILFGGTHKTLPGPTCGIIMTNDDDAIQLLDSKINPDYLRNIQINNVAALLLALIEQERFACEYQAKIVETSNSLARYMSESGFNIAKINNKHAFSQTHQIFVLTDEKECNAIYDNALRLNITLNKKHKPLFNGFGIRIGTQEIARYDWGNDELKSIAEILCAIKNPDVDETTIRKQIEELSAKKAPRYMLDDVFMN